MSGFGYGGFVSIALHTAVILAVYNLRALPSAGFQLDRSNDAIIIELSPETSSETVALLTTTAVPTPPTPVTVESPLADFVSEEARVDLTDPTQVSPIPETSIDLDRQEIEPKQEPLERIDQAEGIAAIGGEMTEPIGRNDQPADFSENAPPTYPLEAVRGRMEGTVLLKLIVNANGEVASVEIRSSSGHPVLDSAAVEAVKKWKGKPAHRFGLAIESEETLPIRFRL